MEDNKTRVQPMRLTDANSGNEYTLEFNREAVRFAERMGLNINELAEKPATQVPILFYAAFRMHHPEVSRAETDRMLTEELGGLTTEELGRLGELYTQAVDVLRLVEGERKNARMTLTLL